MTREQHSELKDLDMGRFKALIAEGNAPQLKLWSALEGDKVATRSSDVPFDYVHNPIFFTLTKLPGFQLNTFSDRVVDDALFMELNSNYFVNDSRESKFTLAGLVTDKLTWMPDVKLQAGGLTGPSASSELDLAFRKYNGAEIRDDIEPSRVGRDWMGILIPS